MSIVNNSLFSYNNDADNDFIIYEYPVNSQVAFKIQCVLNTNYTKENNIPSKSLEGGEFRQDSQNINPYNFSITGIIINDNTGENINALYNKIIDNYLNSIALLTIYNKYTYVIISPVKLYQFSYDTNVDQTIPLVKLSFKQIQVAVDSIYVTSKIQNPKNVQNLPEIIL